MAKRRKVRPGQNTEDGHGEDHSLLLRSAESLGRVIGALHRQLDDAARRMGAEGAGRVLETPATDGSLRKGARTRKRVATKRPAIKAAARKRSGARKKAAHR